MLYNKEWDTPKPDILSLDSLIGWLETKKYSEAYSYVDSRRCLLCQYFTAMGLTNVNVSSIYLNAKEQYAKLPDGFNDIALGRNSTFGSVEGISLTRNFGEALKRARYLSNQKENEDAVVSNFA